MAINVHRKLVVSAPAYTPKQEAGLLEGEEVASSSRSLRSEAIAETNTEQDWINFHCADFSAANSHITTNLHYLHIDVDGPLFIDLEINASV